MQKVLLVQPSLQTRLRTHLEGRKARFSAEQFAQRIREVVRNFPP